LTQARGAGGSGSISIDVKRDSYRPLRGLDPFMFFDPGADAPGFMLTSAPRTETDKLCVKYVITLAKPHLGLNSDRCSFRLD